MMDNYRTMQITGSFRAARLPGQATHVVEPSFRKQ